MPEIDEQCCDEIMHIVGRMLGIIEVSLNLNATARRESLLQLRSELWQLNDRLRDCCGSEDVGGG